MKFWPSHKKKTEVPRFRLRPMDRDYIKITVSIPGQPGRTEVLLTHRLKMLRYYAAVGTKPPIIHVDGGCTYSIEYIRGGDEC